VGWSTSLIKPFDSGPSVKNMIGRAIVTARLVKWVILFAFVIWPAIGAIGEDSVPFLASTPLQNHVIVVGFVGGFVHRDEPHHPEVGLNSNVNEAYQTILRESNILDGGPFSEIKARRPKILLFGHSWGASAVVRLARKLDHVGIPVALTIQVDSVAKPFTNDAIIPSNVSEAANFYQVHGLIHGRSRITAANVKRTRIIGNFRRDYETEPAACLYFPWYSQLFTKGHIEIECDPNLWSEIRVLLEHYIPTDAATAGQFQAPVGWEVP
jgi:hypothetical protein